MSARPVGYLLKKFPRLSETFVLEELLGLEASGLRVHVFSRRRPAREPRHPQLAALAAEVVDLTRVEGWPTAERSEVPSSRSTSAPIDDAPRRRRRLENLETETAILAPLLAARGIAHVHAHFATDSALVAALLHQRGGPGYSVTLHAKDIYREGVRFTQLERIVGGARFAVTVCDANVRHLAAGLSERAMAKVRRLYNGIDLTRFAPVDDAAREPDHVVTVGRLIEKKGIDVLIRAAGVLASRGIHARFTIVGDGDRRPLYEALVEELRLGDRVHFAGAIDQAGVQRLLASAAVFCLPCVVGADGNQDALPTVLLEALASGLPAISTPIGGIAEILDHGRAGVLVPCGDVDATASAIETLLANRSRRRELARAGRLRAEHLFDRSINAGVLAEWMREAMGTSRAQRVAPTASGPRVASINQDPGIDPERRKGAAVHLAAMREALLARGAEVVAIDEPDEPRLRARLAKAHRERPFDLVYERYMLGRNAAAALARQWGVPFVLEVNAPLADEVARWRGGEVNVAAEARDSELFGAAQRVLVVSSDVAAYARRRGAGADAIEVVPNAVDPRRFAPRGPDDETRRRLVPAGRFAIGFHGRLRPWHGLELLARAAALLIERGAPIHLVLVGRGDFAPILADRGVAARVTSIEWVPHDQVGRYVATFDALPLTYPPDLPCYFSPLKLKEAMACAVTPVVPDLGDLTRVVRHGENGLVYSAGDVEGLVAAIERLLGDRVERERLGRAARASALEVTWEDIAARVLEHAADRSARDLRGAAR